MARLLHLLLFFFFATLAVGCVTARDVVSAHDRGDGTVRVVPAPLGETWNATHAALAANHARQIEEHFDDNFMIANAEVSQWSYGARMGVWLEQLPGDRTLVRAVVLQKGPAPFGQNEEMLLDDIESAVADIEQRSR